MTTGSFWSQHKEASLNWIAFGLLLAAWNAAGNAPSPVAPARPSGLRAHPFFSVRAAIHHRTVIKMST